MSRGFLCPVVAAAFFAALPADSARADLIVNGGFETGDFTGWSVEPASAGSAVGVTTVAGSGSSQSVYFAAYELVPDSFFQTVSSVAGKSYALSFQLRNDFVDDDFFQVLWEGSVVTEMSPVAHPDGSWRQYTFQVTATTPGSELRFSAYDLLGYIYLDDVSLVEVAAVPSPASAALGVIGAGFVILRRRR